METFLLMILTPFSHKKIWGGSLFPPRRIYIKLGLENKMKTNIASFLKDLQLVGIILFSEFLYKP